MPFSNLFLQMEYVVTCIACYEMWVKCKQMFSCFCGQNLDILITVSSSGVARVWRRVRRSVFDAAVLSTRVCASISWMSTLANYFTSGSVHSRPERTENQERTGNFLMLPPGFAAVLFCWLVVKTFWTDESILPVKKEEGADKVLTCSWHQKTNSPIPQFTNLKCCIKAKEPFKTPF